MNLLTLVRLTKAFFCWKNIVLYELATKSICEENLDDVA